MMWIDNQTVRENSLLMYAVSSKIFIIDLDKVKTKSQCAMLAHPRISSAESPARSNLLERGVVHEARRSSSVFRVP